MSRQMVLRRILSNGDDRQADRLAQTLPLRRPGKRPGQFLSLSVHPPPPPLFLFVFVSSTSFFHTLHLQFVWLLVLFQELEGVFFFLYTV